MNARTFMLRNVVALVVVGSGIFVICTLQSCTSVASGPSQPPVDISGTWEGSTSAGCFMARGRCNAYRLITMGIVQNGSNLSGSYTCAYGNMICLGDMNSGTIATGRVDGSYMPDLRVQLPNGVDCLYQGHFAGNQGEGGYMCLYGGRMLEQGSWQLKRKS